MNKKKILVVDDEPDFIKMVKARLEEASYEVITAFNGKEALEIVKRERFNAVLLDILMPGLDGLKVLKKIRQYNKYLPVFIITAHSDKKRFDLAKKFNASGFIIKTADLKEEIERIKAALSVADKYKAE